MGEEFKVTQTKEPSNGVLGKKIREIAKNGRSNITPEYELDLFIKDRKEHVSNVIIPALREKHIVIMDRYYYSTIAYQGALGIDPAHIKKINEEKFPRPDIVLILDVSTKVGMSRILKGRKEGNNLGFEQEKYLNKVRKVFKGLRDDPIVQEINATPSIETVFKNIVNLTDDIIKMHMRGKIGLPKYFERNFKIISSK